jgi:signal peptidase II
MSKWRLALVTALVVVVLDQMTKAVVVARLGLHESVSVVDGLFALTYVRNTGAAFGILAGRMASLRVPLLMTVSVLALTVLIWFLRTVASDRWVVVAACGAVFGGALGNLIDRAAYGEVIDFLDVYVGNWHWPAFNVADAAITVGVIVLCVDSLRSEPAPERSLL